MGLLRHRPNAAASPTQHARRARLRRTTAAGLAMATVATAAPLLLMAAPASAVGGKAMWVGAYATGGTSELDSSESGLGKRFDVDHSYITFNNPSQNVLSFVGNDKAAGRAP